MKKCERESTKVSMLRQYATSCLTSLNCCKDLRYNEKVSEKKKNKEETEKEKEKIDKMYIPHGIVYSSHSIFLIATFFIL